MTEQKFKNKYRTKSHRLQGYDYSSTGAYFITICCADRECLFGEIENGKMILNDLGQMVQEEWKRTEQIRKNVFIDEFIVMPNHLHGIIFIKERIPPSVKCDPVETETVETNCNSFLQGRFKQNGTSQTIGSIIRGFKIGVTKYARNKTDVYAVWQPNYYDRIIRNEDELNRIREYIISNLEKWEDDNNNVENIFM